MQDKANDLNAALRSYWLTILLIFLACSATWNIFYWAWLPDAGSLPIISNNSPIPEFLGWQLSVIITSLTIALSFHVPLLMTSNPRRRRSFIFIVLFTLLLVGCGINTFFPSVEVDCVTGQPLDDAQGECSLSACMSSTTPAWLAFAIALITAILSFLCLLNIVQAAKGAMQTKLQERKQSR